MKKILLVVILLIGCSTNTTIEVTQSYHELFDGDVYITFTEDVEKGLDIRTKSADVEIEFNQPGYYLFEGWVSIYRGRDKIGESYEYNVVEVPHREGIRLPSRFYRFEVMRIRNTKIERDKAIFRYRGMGCGSFRQAGKTPN